MKNTDFKVGDKVFYYSTFATVTGHTAQRVKVDTGYHRTHAASPNTLTRATAADVWHHKQATEIAADVFAWGNGMVADRLKAVDSEGVEMGGDLSQNALRDRVFDILRGEA